MCERCEELEERVSWLESELGLQVSASEVEAVRRALRVRPQTARLILAMYHAKGRLMSNMQLFEAMPQEQRPKVDDDRSTKLLDVQICNARKRLGADGILTTWGKGRALSAAGMARVAAILQPNMEQAA